MRSDKEILDWLEEHSVDWDAGMGAYFPFMMPGGFHPTRDAKTFRAAVEQAMDALEQKRAATFTVPNGVSTAVVHVQTIPALKSKEK